MKRPLLIAAFAALAASCATPQTQGPSVSKDAITQEAMLQQRFVIDQRLAESRRVDEIHQRLSLANLEFCKVRSKSIGVEIYALNQYGKQFRDAAAAIGLTDAPTVAYTLDDSPARAAGLLPGDIITHIDGKAIEQKASGARKTEKTIAEWKTNTIPIAVTRRGQPQTFDVPTREICGYKISVAQDDELNAYADGKSIVLTRRLLSVIENDNQLALVVGHELAHNALGHIDAKQTNQAIGMAGGLILDVLVAATTGYASSDFMRLGGQLGAGAYSKGFESEADYAGMFFIARAGYGLDNVENVWRRFALEDPSGISFGGTHPTTPERFLAISAAREEIDALKTAGAPLRPRLKKDGEIDTRFAQASAASGPAPTDAAPPLAPSATSPTQPEAGPPVALNP